MDQFSSLAEAEEPLVATKIVSMRERSHPRSWTYDAASSFVTLVTAPAFTMYDVSNALAEWSPAGNEEFHRD